MSDQAPHAAPPTGPDQRRRRFLGAGAAATPGVLTLVSQPALGVTCFTPSRSLSRNTSVSAGPLNECLSAQSPGNYMARATGQPGCSWPSSVPSSTPFHPTFPGWVYTKMVSGHTVSKTMMEVMQATNGKLTFFLLAAYLNCMGGNGAQIPPAVLTPAKVIQMWADVQNHGFYEPTAGVQWREAEIKDYLFSNGIIL